MSGILKLVLLLQLDAEGTLRSMGDFEAPAARKSRTRRASLRPSAHGFRNLVLSGR